jgi:hypothetical protein
MHGPNGVFGQSGFRSGVIGKGIPTGFLMDWVLAHPTSDFESMSYGLTTRLTDVNQEDSPK